MLDQEKLQLLALDTYWNHQNVGIFAWKKINWLWKIVDDCLIVASLMYTIATLSPILMYSSECWRGTKADMKKITASCKGCLRKGLLLARQNHNIGITQTNVKQEHQQWNKAEGPQTAGPSASNGDRSHRKLELWWTHPETHPKDYLQNHLTQNCDHRASQNIPSLAGAQHVTIDRAPWTEDWTWCQSLNCELTSVHSYIHIFGVVWQSPIHKSVLQA